MAQILEYTDRHHDFIGRSRSIATLAVVLSSVCVLTCLFVVEGLHNSVEPFFVLIWFVCGAKSIALLISHSRVTRGRRLPRFALVWSVVMLSIGGMLGGLRISGSLTGGDPHFYGRNRNHCIRNLESISEAADLYATDHNGQYPQDLLTILQMGDLQPEFFRCPATDRRGYNSKPTTQEIMDATKPDGNASYVYIGAGLRRGCSPDTVIAYDRPDNHSHDRGPKGISVVFADHRVFEVDPRVGQMLTDDLKKGHNPPSSDVLARVHQAK